MSIALNTAILDLIQQQYLVRDIHEALRPNQMFRSLVPMRESWEARNGETHYMTRNGLLPVRTKPRTPGVDPTPQNKVGLEQWYVTCYPYNDGLDTNLPDSYIMIQDEILRDARSLMIQAGVTLNHIVRNKMYNTYLGGNTVVDTTATSTSIHVKNLTGFDNAFDASGRLQTTSASAPYNVLLGASKTARQVIGFTPDDINQPYGAGLLLLNASVSVTAGDVVVGVQAPLVYRVGGGLSTDAITSANILTYSDVRNVVAYLRAQNVYPMDDGTYHCHLDPAGESQLLNDAQLGRILTGVPEAQEWADFTIGRAAGVTFFRNNETPNTYNTSYDDFIGASMVNAGGATIHRPMIYGKNMIMEKYIPLDKMYDQAAKARQVGAAVISDFNISQDQSTADLMMDGIKYVLRAPQDRLQENVAQTWSFKGDWACPTDSLTGVPAMYKRGVVMEHSA